MDLTKFKRGNFCQYKYLILIRGHFKGKIMPSVNETSLQTYQNFDGSNTTMLLHSETYSNGKGLSLSAGLGGSTNFCGKNSVILEGKAKYNIDSHFSAQVRLRNSFSVRGSYSQLRFAPGYKTNVKKNVSIYANPYAAVKYNYLERDISTDIGAFAGCTYKLPKNFSITGEVQKYNGFKDGPENWGVNVILSYNF